MVSYNKYECKFSEEWLVSDSVEKLIYIVV